MRWLCLALALAACSNGSGPSILDAARGALSGETTAAPSGKKTPPRAAIEKTGLALVQMNLAGEETWPILQPRMRNGNRVVYVNKTRQSLTLVESQIVATRGLGWDLIAATSDPVDPLSRVTPPDAWPSEVTRRYRFAGEGPEGHVLTYRCTLTRGAPGQIRLAGTPFAVIRFEEDCSGSGPDFTNTYAADSRTGRVWVSQQWVGPRMPLVNLDVLEPLSP